MLEVTFKNNVSGENVYSGERIYSPDGKALTFSSVGVANHTTTQMGFKSYYINGNKMTATTENFVNFNANGSIERGIASVNHIYVVSVVGYR